MIYDISKNREESARHMTRSRVFLKKISENKWISKLGNEMC